MVSTAPKCFTVLYTGSQSEKQRDVNDKMIAYTKHHASCEECRKHDWYMPGFPRLITKENDKMPGDRTFKIKDREVRVRMAPDPEVLCKEGRRLFRRWERAIFGVYLGGRR